MVEANPACHGKLVVLSHGNELTETQRHGDLATEKTLMKWDELPKVTVHNAMPGK
jgi:hypothetical protein